MTFHLQEQLDSSKECKISRDLRLVQREDSRTIVVVDLYFTDASGGNVPGLFLRHGVRKNFSRAIRNAKFQNIPEVVLNRVPARRPGRQAQRKRRLTDILDYGCYVKLLSLGIGKTDGVIDSKCASLRVDALRQEEKENKDRSEERRVGEEG